MLTLFASLMVRAAILVMKVQRKFIQKMHRNRPFEASQRALAGLLGDDRLSAFDIGGALGLVPHWHKLLGTSDFFVFEPHPQSFSELKEHFEGSPHPDSFHLFPYALSGRSGPRTLYMTNAPTGTGLVPMNMSSRFVVPDNPYIFPVTERRIDTLSLAEVFSREKLSAIDLIKLDVQGAEQEILEGLGAERLGELLCVEMEVPLQDCGDGATTVDGIWRFLRGHGFEVYDVRTARHYARKLTSSSAQHEVLGEFSWDPAVAAMSWEFEFVAFRNPLPLLAAGQRRKLLRLIACYCVYNFYFDALELADWMVKEKLASAEERREWRRHILDMRNAIRVDLAPHRVLWEAQGAQNWGQYCWLKYPTT